jgi:hypothetical protein
MASGEIVKGDLDADGRVTLYIIKGIARNIDIPDLEAN